MLETRITNYSPDLEEALKDFEELTFLYGNAKVIVDIIDYIVWQKTKAPQTNPLKPYTKEEVKSINYMVEIFRSEVETRIKRSEVKKKLWKLPEIELTYKNEIPLQKRRRITNTEDCYRLFLNHWSDQIELLEEFNILLIDRAGGVIGFYNVSKGGSYSTVVDAKIIFAAALKANAKQIVLAHNHPSGNINPSAADIKLTKDLKKAADLLEIILLDHLIITPTDYYSLLKENDI